MSDNTEPNTETTSTDTTTGTDAEQLRAELDKWKSLARQNENLAKKANKERDDAVTAAREEGRLAGRIEAGQQTVLSEFRAAFGGRDFDVDSYLEAIDVHRFMDDTGSPRTDAIRELADKLVPIPAPAPPAATAVAQLSTFTPPALNSDPLLADLKSKLGITS